MGAPTPPGTGAIQGGATAATGQQTALNTAAQQQNQYNQKNPYGSLNYVITGYGPNGTPQYTAVENLSPEQQNLYNQYTGTQTTAGGQAGKLLSGANYGSTSPTDAIGSMSSGLTQQMMGAYQAGVDPFYKTQTDQLHAQLLNEGVHPGEPAYDNAMRQLLTNQGLAMQQAAAQFEPQAFGQATLLYQMPMTMGQQLAQFGAPTTPNASFTTNTPQTQPADIAAMLSAEIPAYMQPYGAQYQQYGNLMSGLFGLGGAGLKGLMAA